MGWSTTPVVLSKATAPIAPVELLLMKRTDSFGLSKTLLLLAP